MSEWVFDKLAKSVIDEHEKRYGKEQAARIVKFEAERDKALKRANKWYSMYTRQVEQTSRAKADAMRAEARADANWVAGRDAADRRMAQTAMDDYDRAVKSYAAVLSEANARAEKAEAERDACAAALREIARLRLATDEGSLRVRADRMWEIASGRPV